MKKLQGQYHNVYMTYYASCKCTVNREYYSESDPHSYETTIELQRSPEKNSEALKPGPH